MERVLDKPVGTILDLNWEKALYLTIVVLALTTRMWGLGDRVQSHDESIHTKYSWNLYAGHGFAHDPLMHGPYLFHVTALSYFLFGDNDFSARVPVALMGVAVVALPYLFRRWLGRAGALAASLFLLISPSITYYSRYIRHDIPAVLWAGLILLAILSYLREGRNRWLYVLAGAVALLFATKEVAFIYSAIFGFFLVGALVVRAMGQPWANNGLKRPLLWAAAAALAGLALWGTGAMRLGEDGVIAWWAKLAGGATVALLLVATVLFLLGMGRNLRRGDEQTRRTFDLVVVLGTLCLPLLSPILINLMGLDSLDYHAPTIYYSAAIGGSVLAISAVIGLWWNARRWLATAAVHYAIFVVLFTTFFTNGFGIASGMFGSLGYWLVQQEVERGSQPQHYYLVMTSFYEFLPVLLSLAALVYLAVPRRSGEAEERWPHKTGRTSLPEQNFILLLIWWTALSWLGYSMAGERMPWLTVHIAFPMILLSGWFAGRLIEETDWPRVFRHQVWLLAVAIPSLALAIAMLVRAASSGPFQGFELTQLNDTGGFIGGLTGTLAFGAMAAYIVRRGGWRPAGSVTSMVLLLLLTLLTIRTGWRLAYVSFDYPTEFLVYAHAGPAVNEAVRQIEEISRRTVGNPTLVELSFGADGSTLFYWQFRNFPNAVFYGEQPSREQMEAPIIVAGRDQWDAVGPYLGDDYVVNTYTYIWWPMEDYRNLTWSKLARAAADSQLRAALWDIWYDRDFERYDKLTGKSHTLDAWPLRSDFRLYVRRDIASQMWDMGAIGEVGALPLGPNDAAEADPYVDGWQELEARLVFGDEGSLPGQFQSPRGIDVAANGFIYVADSGNHRIQKFTLTGEFVAAWGEHSSVDTETGMPQGFNEPWGLTVTPGGGILVADTWNHRIQELDAEGEVLGAWGLFGQFSTTDRAGQSAFYGPRDITVDSIGNIYVADTGNRRIQVFDRLGEFMLQWGGGGVLEGYLDEPVGVAIGPGEEVFVADTWNRRVQVFTKSGQFLREWPVLGWETADIEEKPYLTVDADGYVYTTDPSNYRVLVFDSWGNYVLSFGQYGFDERSLTYPTGIAVDQGGSIYIADAHSGRVMVFGPLDLSASITNLSE